MTTVWRCAWQEKTNAAQNGVDHDTYEEAMNTADEVAARVGVPSSTASRSSHE